jgi:aminoglycoside phosphotransferase (APT) family kinase protein
MHADEVDIDVALVRRLIVEQLPQWAGLPVEPVPSSGTDNALYRLGSELVARLPRTPRTAATLARELEWLPRLGPLLPLPVPEPVAEGEPQDGFPFAWSVYRWLDGEEATRAPVDDPHQLADDLAEFTTALQQVDSTGGPPPADANAFRGEPLRRRDAVTRAAIAAVGDEIDVDAATRLWEEGIEAPDWDRPPVWIHGDLDRRNLLVRGGRVSAVIDWGCVGVGDPACDAMAAFKLLMPDARELRAALELDEATWVRARGWTLHQAVSALSYYTDETNPGLVAEARHWLAAVLSDSA